MFSFETDAAKNLFIVRYSGHITAADISAQVESMRTTIATMQPGFGLLADFTDLELMDADCAPHIREIMDFANSCGIAAVVRVIPDPHRDIGMQIMSRFHYGDKVQIATVPTIEQAMKLLFD